MSAGGPFDLDRFRISLEGLGEGDPGLQFNAADTTAGLLDELDRRLAGLGQRARGWRAVPESVGWIALYSRTLAVANANRMAHYAHDAFTLQVLWRAAFEIQYHLIVISDPARIRWPQSVQEEDDSPEHAMSTNDRLCAYLAYGLWNDSRYYGLLTQGWLLRTVWDKEPRPANSEQEAFLKLAEHILGEDAPGADPDSRAARRENQQWTYRQKDRIDAWLAHPRLATWVRAIRAINGGRGPATFYGVLNPRRDSLGQDTFKTPLAVATPEYGRTSSLLHGSTVDEFLDTGDGRIGPAIFRAADVERETRGNIYALLMCWLLLHSLAASVGEVAA